MKKLQKLLFVIVMMITIQSSVMAQDKMLMRGARDSVAVKVTEIGVDEVKYKLWPIDDNMPLMVEKRDRIICIRFANGKVMYFTKDEFSNTANYEGQHTAVIKIDPFALLLNLTSIAYEKSMKPGMSWEVGTGFIGLAPKSSNADYSEHYGLLLRAGIKFINTPDYYHSGMRYAHILKGSYIRPEVVLVSEHIAQNVSGWTYIYNSQTGNYQYYEGKVKRNTLGAAFMINFGKQWIMADMIAIDLFGGVGIGYKSENSTAYYSKGSSSYNYDSYSDPSTTGFISGTNNMSFAAQGGLKIGYLIGRTTSTPIMDQKRR